MKKTIAITIVCTAIATVFLVLGGAFLIKCIQNRDWREDLKGSTSCTGEIVSIVLTEEGKILSIVDSQSGQTKEFLVYEDTVVEGQLGETTLAQMLDKQIAGVYVSVEAYDAQDGIVDGRILYPAKAVKLSVES